MLSAIRKNNTDYDVMLSQMKIHNEKFMAAFTNQDPESIGPLYTCDCKVMPTGQDVIEGREGTLKNDLAAFTVLYIPCM